MRTISELGFAVPDILLPQQGTDLKKWAVIACDQYTSEPEYWENVSKEAGDSPSTLNLVLPEVYLGTGKEAEKLGSIADTARKYLDDGILRDLGTGFILTDRKTELHPSRKGLMAAIDLEGYSFEPGNKNICRATELPGWTPMCAACCTDFHLSTLRHIFIGRFWRRPATVLLLY